MTPSLSAIPATLSGHMVSTVNCLCIDAHTDVIKLYALSRQYGVARMSPHVRSRLERRSPRASSLKTQGAFAHAYTRTGRLSGHSEDDVAPFVSFLSPSFSVFFSIAYLGCFSGHSPISFARCTWLIILCSLVPLPLQRFSV
jgi:hypothetical protein